jgi:putative transcriptional regulator
MKTKNDWSRADARTDEQIHTAALADPNAQPLTPERLKAMKQTPRLKIIRRALGLTQEEFAARFQIPLGTLRDWEQGAKEPDQAARAYLRAIAGDPVAVERALHAVPQQMGRPAHGSPGNSIFRMISVAT